MRKLFLSVFLWASLSALAQDVRTVEAEYFYVVPEDVSLAAGKKTALDHAKIQAIADAYGTVVSQTNTMRMANRNGTASMDFLSIGGSDVKGEWIETIGEPLYDISYDSGQLMVHVKAKGRIREIVSNGIEFHKQGCCAMARRTALSRRNSITGIISTCRSHHQWLAMSPFTRRDVGNDAVCLLPYQQQQEGIYEVKANQRYVFFSVEDAPPVEKSLVDLYNMTSLYPVEQNHVYVIFSPQPFVKASDNDAGEPEATEG